MVDLPLVPIEWRAMPLGKLLPLVGEKFGRRLAADASVADLPVLVRIEPGEKPSAILAAIARCVYGEWTTGADGTLRLRRDPVAWRTAIADERARTIEAWKRALEEIGRRAPIGLFAPTEGRFWSRMPIAIPPKDLATMPPLGIVYATQPTRAQRPLPPKLAEAVRLLNAEAGPREGLHPVRTVARVVPNAPDSDRFRIIVRTFAANGALVRSRGTEISPYTPLQWLMTPRSTDYVRPNVPVADPRFAFSPLALAHRDWITEGRSDWRAQLVPLVSDPRTFDPFAGMASERTVAEGVMRRRSIVRWFGESDQDLFGDLATRSTPRAGEPTSGPLVFRPARPVRDTRIRSDRGVLARAARAIRSPDEPTLAARTEYAAASMDRPADSLFGAWFGWPMSRLNNHADDFPPPGSGIGSLLGVVAGLPFGVRQGGRVAIRSLLPAVRRRCWSFLYDAYFSRASTDYRFEPTVRWPDGPPDGVVTVTRWTDPVVTPRPVVVGRSTTSWRPLDRRELVNARRRSQRATNHERLTDWSRLRPGIRTSLRVVLRFSPDVAFSETFTEVAWSSPDYLPTSRLPKTFRGF